MGWIIALLGLAASGAGGWAIFTGWPIVSLERGWTMVVAGAALSSAGVICFSLAMQILETRRTRLAIERSLAQLAEQIRERPALGAPLPSPITKAELRDTATPAPSPIPPQAPIEMPRHVPIPRPVVSEAPTLPPIPRMTPTESRPAIEEARADDLQPARSFSVGDTTFVVFVDGSIEARTAGGTRRFDSMDEVRAYLESSVS